jgi:hypothetical protein
MPNQFQEIDELNSIEKHSVQPLCDAYLARAKTFDFVNYLRHVSNSTAI